jgi:uncharacterized protein DUF6544
MVMLRRTFSRELAAMGLTADGRPGPVVTEADLAPLPRVVQRYLRFMRVVGRPRDTAVRMHLRGRFRPGAAQGWLACEAWQYDSQKDVARIFHMRLRMFGVPVYGRDVYVGGHGRMLIRPLDLFTVQDAKGPAYDVGELVTYLNDAIFFAPSMLLVPGVAWSGVDDASFDVAISDRGLTASARVFLDACDAPEDFETTDRFAEDPFTKGRPLVRGRWRTPIDGYAVVDGRPLPTAGRAVWHLPKGEFPYAEFTFEPGDVAFNVAPGA